VIAYRAILDVPIQLARYVARRLAAERRARGTRKNTRALSCYRQAVFALVWFREKADIPNLGRGFGLSQATAYRYLNEAIDALAAQAPDLHEALQRAQRDGLPHLILDGKIVDTDRLHLKTLSTKGKTIDVWYSGKTHDFGGNIQAIFAPGGLPLWVSDVLPGNTHDLTAARAHVLDARSSPRCRSWPIPDTKAQAKAYSPRSNNPATAVNSTPTPAPTTRYSGPCAASANAASPCSPNAGAPCNTSPSAPAESATSPKPPSFSSISNTT
jgi:hypothetical protein